MIELKYLLPLQGKSFLYPSAGTDWHEAIDLFSPYISSFWFVDINYVFDQDPRPMLADDANFVFKEKQIDGNPQSVIENKCDEDGRRFRFLEPSVLKDWYEYQPTNRIIEINFWTVLYREAF